MSTVTYPKPIMTTSELMKMGFPRRHLEAAYRDKSQTFATKVTPGKKTSTILYDTAGFEQWRQRQITAQRGRP